MKDRKMKERIFVYCTFVIIILTACAIRPTPEQMASADYGSYPDNYEDIIRNHYSKTLFDPYSAVYTFGRPQRAWNGLGGTIFGWAVCGTINAKNRFGGYVGAKPFFALIRYGKVEREYTEIMAEGLCKNIPR